jgi:glycerate kinase
VFSSNIITPDVSFAAALRGSGDQQQQSQKSQVPVALPSTAVKQDVPAPALQHTGQSVQAPLVKSQTLDNMLRIVTVVQQIMTEVSGAQSQEEQIVAITKIVLKLMNQDGH